MFRRLLVSTIAAALAACSPESKIEPLRVTSSGTMPQGVMNVQYTFPVEITGGTAPFTFSAAIPAEIDWLAIDPDTGVLSGVPDVEQASPVGFVVNAVDANQQTASTTLTLKVVFCVENEVRTCTTVGTDANAGKCMQSQYVCTNDDFPACPAGTLVSKDIDACGAACGACVRAKADRCDGECSCGGGSACGDATTCCSGACVDTTSDELNCGTCGTVCSAAPAHGTPACTASGCSFECETGYTKCGDACVNTQTDGSNCGSCGNVCQPEGARCNGGGQCAMECPYATTYCNGGCLAQSAFTNGDPLNCGECNKKCPTPPANAHATCTSSTCGTECNPGFTLCNGVCVDLANDQHHCGSCTNDCGTDAYGYDYYCSNSVCGSTCAAGYTYCAVLDDCIPTGSSCRYIEPPPDPDPPDPWCKLSGRYQIYCP